MPFGNYSAIHIINAKQYEQILHTQLTFAEDKTLKHLIGRWPWNLFVANDLVWLADGLVWLAVGLVWLDDGLVWLADGLLNLHGRWPWKWRRLMALCMFVWPMALKSNIPCMLKMQFLWGWITHNIISHVWNARGPWDKQYEDVCTFG